MSEGYQTGRPQHSIMAPELGLHPGVRHLLVAWLVRTTRQYGGHGLGQVQELAAVFSGGCWPDSVHPSKISRWETGKAQIPYLAVRRYEDLLGIATHGLVSVIDTLNRYFAVEAVSRPALARPSQEWTRQRHERIATLIDKALGTATMTGLEWDELTNFLAVTPQAVLPRPGAFADLAERLLQEMIIADGLAWMQRYEAFSRLLSHPIGQQDAVAACASLGADRTNQVFIDTLCALDGSAHADATRHLLRQLRTPTNDRAFYGALLACVRKNRYGHFDRDAVTDLAEITGQLITDTTVDDSVRELAGEVLAGLPRHWLPPATVRLRRPATVASPALAPAPLVRRILAAAGSPEEFDMLRLLVAEMIANPVSDIRLYTAMLLSASPYRAALAGALAAELGRRHDPGLVRSIVDALRVLGDADSAPAVRDLVLRPDVPAPVRQDAAFTVGHLGGRADPFWRDAIALHTRRWTTFRDDTSATVVTGLVYGLGITGNDGLLAQLLDGDAPTPARAAAAWWLRLPSAVRASAGL